MKFTNQHAFELHETNERWGFVSGGSGHSEPRKNVMSVMTILSFILNHCVFIFVVSVVFPKYLCDTWNGCFDLPVFWGSHLRSHSPCWLEARKMLFPNSQLSHHEVLSNFSTTNTFIETRQMNEAEKWRSHQKWQKKKREWCRSLSVIRYF